MNILISRISEETIETVRRSNNIVEVIGEYITLKKMGKNYQGLCPFHSEKSPSFSVAVDKQLFHCFGCKAGGDVFNFLMRIENIDFHQAVSILAKRAGIALAQGNEIKSEKDNFYDLNLMANRYFHYLLCKTKGGNQALEYLKNRGLNLETIKKFRLGYASNQWDGLLKAFQKRGIKAEDLNKVGLVVAKAENKGYYDRFRHRLIFPILDIRGKVLGFGGRVLDNSLPKYLNSPETVIYSKSKSLYGLYYAQNSIREKKQVIVVEGYLDFLTLYQAGVENVVASLGTALTSEQGKLIARLASEVIIAYDGDKAGEAASIKGIEVFQFQGLKIKVLPLPSGEDPDSLVRKNGKERFLSLVDQALPWVEYLLNNLFSNYPEMTGENKGEVVEKALEILYKIQNQVQRDEYIRYVGEKLSVREDILRSEMVRFSRGTQRGKLRNKVEEIRNNNNESMFDFPSYSAEKTLLSLILKNEEIALWSKERISSEDFFYNEHKRIFSLLGELNKIIDRDWAQWVDKLEDERLREKILSLLLEEIPQVEEPKKIALDCLQALKKYQLDEKIIKKQEDIKQAEERGESTRVRTLLAEYQELINQKKELTRD